MYVPCGKCTACLLARKGNWVRRINMELYSLSSAYNSVYITLTYRDEDCPLSLDKSVLQKFIKRVRKSFSNDRVKHFSCGEYGEQYGRPHYHCIIWSKTAKVFNYDFERSWKFGFVDKSIVHSQAVKYVVDYLLKKVKTKDIYKGLEPPFQLYSKGLGLDHLHRELYTILNKKDIHKEPKYFVRKLQDAGLLDKDEMQRKAVDALHAKLWKMYTTIPECKRYVDTLYFDEYKLYLHHDWQDTDKILGLVQDWYNANYLRDREKVSVKKRNFFSNNKIL